MNYDNSAKKKKKTIYLTLIVSGLLVIAGIGTIAYFAWPKHKSVQNQPPTNPKTEVQKLQTELNSLKSKLDNISDATQKKRLEKELSSIKNQVNNLSGLDLTEDNITPPVKRLIKKLEVEIKEIKQNLENDKPKSPTKNPPSPEKKDKPNKSPKPNEEPDSDDLVSTIWKWSSSDKKGYQLFESDKNNNFKVYIAKDNSLIKGKKLDNWDDAIPFSIRFNKKDASKQEGDKTFYFEEDNTNFEINPFGEWPDEPSLPTPPTKNQYEIQFTGCLREYANFNNLGLGINLEVKFFKISVDHPLIQKLAGERKLKKNKKFTIRYETEDETANFGKILIFNQDNSKLELEEN